MSLTRVVSIRGGKSYDVYVGRPGRGEGGYFGNPYAKGRVCSRCRELHESAASTLPCFLAYFLERLGDDAEFRVRVRDLKGKVLGCFCLPGDPCHAVIISNWLNRSAQEIERELDFLVWARTPGAQCTRQ